MTLLTHLSNVTPLLPSPYPASSSLRRADLSFPLAYLLPRDEVWACYLAFSAQELCLAAVLSSCVYTLTWARPTLGSHPGLASGLAGECVCVRESEGASRGREREA